jgi:hypothetical protein
MQLPLTIDCSKKSSTVHGGVSQRTNPGAVFLFKHVDK